MDRKVVMIKENSWLARLGARKLKSDRVALVFRNTIHLHNVSKAEFLRSRSWVLHELKHVHQFAQMGTIGFVWKYVWETMKNGYFNNALEIEARAAENEEHLLQQYEIRH